MRSALSLCTANDSLMGRIVPFGGNPHLDTMLRSVADRLQPAKRRWRSLPRAANCWMRQYRSAERRRERGIAQLALGPSKLRPFENRGQGLAGELFHGDQNSTNCDHNAPLLPIARHLLVRLLLFEGAGCFRQGIQTGGRNALTAEIRIPVGTLFYLAQRPIDLRQSGRIVQQ